MRIETLRLLKPVSRSFYLTIRALPSALREPVGLAYLLARASDTIADSAHVAAGERLECLDLMRTALREGGADGLRSIAGRINPAQEGERLLLEQLSDCVDVFRSAEKRDRNTIAEVLSKIIRGQELDLLRFSINGSAIQTQEELEEYTYLVAGCVGEFWTRICALHLPRFARLDLERMNRLGMRFGQGLQLINILRDIPEDLKAGRCYLPLQELREAGANPATMNGAEPVFEKWHLRAVEYLEEAYAYIAALPSGRVRYACILPWHIGVQTLRQIGGMHPWKSAARVKVSRADVRRTCARAILAALSNAALERLKDG